MSNRNIGKFSYYSATEEDRCEKCGVVKMKGHYCLKWTPSYAHALQKANQTRNNTNRVQLHKDNVESSKRNSKMESQWIGSPRETKQYSTVSTQTDEYLYERKSVSTQTDEYLYVQNTGSTHTSTDLHSEMYSQQTDQAAGLEDLFETLTANIAASKMFLQQLISILRENAK